ncbi:hypothetical protein GCM10022258_20980 [Aquimarina gracilis]
MISIVIIVPIDITTQIEVREADTKIEVDIIEIIPPEAEDPEVVTPQIEKKAPAAPETKIQQEIELPEAGIVSNT